MTWLDDAEMPVVQGSNLGDAEPFSDRDHGGVHDPRRHVDVLGNQPGHASDVRCGDLGYPEPIAAERLEEGDVRGRTKARPEQVANLAEHRRKNLQRPLGLAQQVEAGVVRVVLDIARSQQHSRVAQSMSAAQLGTEDLF